MMIAGGPLSIEGNARLGEDGDAQPEAASRRARRRRVHAERRLTWRAHHRQRLHRHVPAIGAASTSASRGRAVLAEGVRRLRVLKVDEGQPPDVSSSSSTTTPPPSAWMIPTFAIGTAAGFADRRRGLGRAPGAGRPGPPELAAHIAQSVIQDDFDLTIVNRMDVDHGLTVPLSSCAATVPARAWPFAGHPVRGQRGAVPGASGAALLRARAGDPPRGRALRRALNVQIWGTGGMSHQLRGRAPG